MQIVAPAGNDLVSVNLKTLVDLAKSAASIGQHHGGRRAAQSGAYLSRFKGRGMEFDEARPYQAGDDVRSIDWRVTARTGRTHTKIFREERERPIFISVDYRATMAFATRGVFKSVQAAKLAAILAWAAKSQGDRIGGQVFSDSGCLELKPHHGKHAVLRFLNTLVEPAYTLNDTMLLEHALSRLVQHARPGSRVYLISDFRGIDQGVENHLLKLSRHCEVVLIHIFDPLESQLPLSGQYRFTDESRELVIDASDRSRVGLYQQRFMQQQRHLQRLSKRLKLSLLQCSTLDIPLDALR